MAVYRVPFRFRNLVRQLHPKINVVDENGDSIGRQHKSNSVEDLAALDSPGSGTSSQMRMSLSNEAKKLTTRASELIVHVPAKHFRRIVETRGMSSVTRETQHFVGVTTVNGLLRIYRSKGKYRFFWVGSLIQLYTKKPTVSQVSFLLPEQGLIFPAVTICSYNPIKKNYIEGVNKTGSFSRRLLDYLNLAFMEVQFLLSINNPQELELANQEYEYYSTRTNPQFSLGGFFWNASLSCTEMLKICSFGGREFDCCQYARGILTDIGKCYQLDLAQTDELWLKQQIQAGVNNGLQIIADFHTEQQIGVFDMDAGPPLANEFETGFRYYVHGSKAGVHLSTEGISVSPGTKVYSAISPTTYILLPTEKWGNCTPKWPTEYAAQPRQMRHTVQ
uniref:Uncharacterized protein n=1 Tax=Ditylenchus dipsaci TaxID=166011 RepID=A0A915CPJ9_9BILA